MALKLSFSPFLILQFFKLIKIIHEQKPDIVQTWMYHADFYGGFAARFAGIRNVIWGIRNSSLKLNRTKITTIILVRILAIFSWVIPKKIISCANKAAEIHKKIGYNFKKIIVINNGVNTKSFKPFSTKKINLRKKLSLPISSKVHIIGSVSRFDPQKNHKILLESLFILKQKEIKFICLLVGSGLNKSNKILKNWVSQLKLSENIRIYGQQENIPFFMNVLDLHILQSSYGEAFPNVVAEAMACGTPCIVTDVGDSSRIVGKTGWVVPPNDPFCLANTIEFALKERLTKKWREKKINARNRIAYQFNQQKMITNFYNCWQKTTIS